MASSLTTNAGPRRRVASTSKSSTARTPVTPSSPATRSAGLDRPARPGRGRARVPGRAPRCRSPSVCTVSTTGHAAACPDGLRASEDGELAAEGHPLLEEQTVRRPTARASQSASSSAEATTPHALAVVSAAGGLGHDRPPDLGAEGLGVGRGVGPRPTAGTECPSAPSRSRIASLSWANRSARGRGVQRRRPRRRAASRTSAGTCSWSKVTTSQAGRSRARPRRRCGARPGELGTTRAALASSDSASTLTA